MAAKWESVVDESNAFLSEVRQIETWWQTDRQKHIKRPYSAESIAALRNIGFKIEYPSSTQGLKLWHMLKEHNANDTYDLTFGTTDPLVAREMATSMRTVYVSGGLAGHAQANFPGDDHADYPADLVPSIVKRIFNTQLFQDQSQNQLRMKYPKEERKHLECIDYMLPIVADADMGFGTLTGCMKLVRNFVEAGVAMIHIDDLAMGLKKFTNGEGRTIVPTSEYLTRLTAVRMTFDIMGCDSHGAEFITSVSDPRDHPYVLGATNTVRPFAEIINEAAKTGKPYSTAKSEWKAAAGLMTFDEAVRAMATDDQYKLYQDSVAGKVVALRESRALAERLLGQRVEFDWELPRTTLGQYMWQWSSRAVIDRCLVAAPLGDLSWSRQDMHEFLSAIRAVYPDRMFAFGFTGSYDFSKGGYSPQEIESFHSDIAKMGVVWQFQPVWAMQGPSVQTRQFADRFAKGGMAYYMREVATPAIASMPKDGKGNPVSRGGHLADSFFDVVAGRDIICRE
ncbi:isocitrate lyase [Fusarium tjaetaba]|uniref:Isocitrate lyase n=1 Tax=Fusarium tjaetaba TaxID=1567544 RepID=A0A8H5R2E0_9HYPO|nr:isocitrate lyase [Fusarium tjaetaba]KAF5626801.1 isocitrate lyase [Fusarium tjaetaba]